MHFVKEYLICVRLVRMINLMSCYLHANIIIVLTAEISGSVIHVKRDCSYS
jgi:hypothetical protein